MKKIIAFYFKIYLFWLLLFIIEKPLFIICHLSLFEGCSFMDCLQVMVHGLWLDTAMAGYFSAFPCLLMLVAVWTSHHSLAIILKSYNAIAALLASTAFVLNIALYGYWGFPLDSTPLLYFMTSPGDAMASVSIWISLLGIVFMLGIAYGIYRLVSLIQLPEADKQWQACALGVVLTAFLFIPIRGGFSVAANNTGKVYFSENQRLNHAAVNPLFSFMESISHEEDFADQYRYFEGKEAEKIVTPLLYTKSVNSDTLLNTHKPNVILIIMESFSSKLMKSLGGNGVAVNLDKLGNEGVLFTNFYANSFRTDRGLIAIQSGYPAQPTMSIMKYPHKTESLPAIARSFSDLGYSTKYFYGGDANFTNMRSYLVNSGFTDIISDVSFPIQDRLSKWGVPDHLVFEKALKDIQSDKSNKPSYCVIQTSSSHEPFDVPFHKLKDPILNAFAYTDDCIGKFISGLRALPEWKNTLVVLVPDHQGCYPENLNGDQLEHYQIPLIMAGGAIAKPRKIDTFGSQQDIAATLLGQLGIDHSKFSFSKDLLDSNAPHFAFFDMPDLFGFVTATDAVIFDNKSKKALFKQGKNYKKNEEKGKAYLQTIYDDIAKR